MTEDRFADLGSGDGRQSPAQRLAELDELDLAQQRESKPAGPPPRPAGRYMWVVGVVFVIAIAVAGVNALRHSGGSLHGPQLNKRLPQFAAPLATSSLDGDANVKQTKQQSNQLGAEPACQVHVPGSITSCALSRKPLVLSVIVPGAKKCEAQLDLFQRMAAAHPRTQFAAVVSGGSHAKVAALVHRHGWTFPVAVDRDLSVFNLYHVAVCPTTVFALRGGVVKRTSIEPLSQQQVLAGLRAIGGA
ncbi:MAG TPA: hypothetical protein VJU60_11185 [Thermoleophilaceae bacterium]|nr:hypothetical protein [Thermoleophilaceae bacterium]